MSLFTNGVSEDGVYTHFRASIVNMGTYICGEAPIIILS